MKLFNPKNPVKSSWIAEYGYRLDARPFLSGGVEARKLLAKLKIKKEPLLSLTNGIYHAGREGRTWVLNSKYGVPFLSSRDFLAADLSRLPYLAKFQVENSPKFLIEDQWILISRSGTVGRTVFSSPDMQGLACSEHVMRVVPNKNCVPPGYVFAFLSSRFGVPMVVSGTYGSVIRSLEPEHLVDLPVPRLGDSVELSIHQLITECANKRARFRELQLEATNRIFAEIDMADFTRSSWHERGPELGYKSKIGRSLTLRALNYSPRVSEVVGSLRNRKHLPLGKICEGGKLKTGPRFKRIACDESFGVRLIGQKQGFWTRPIGRWIAPNQTPNDVFVSDETVLVASSGTLGETEVYGRPLFVTGSWREFAFTQHFLRIHSGIKEVSGAYLFAFLRSELAFRCLRSMSTGSKQQEIHPMLIADFPIPLISSNATKFVENSIRDAFKLRDEADVLEDTAILEVEEAIGSSA